ncbi:MAG: DUF1501 domain-containing protein [Planctomycetota bacterium]|nr:DUF1501 domain-containing protein [Planctomycetota bacterium]
MPCTDAETTYGFNRREALQIGVGMFGLSLPQVLRAQQAVVQARSGDMSCIFIFLAGGASHFETFDPKPHAPSEIRGLWNPTATNVPGTFICEKMPLMAQRMDKVAIVRSWQGKSGSHSTGSQHVTSGMYPKNSGQYFPNFGNLVSAVRGGKVTGMPPHFGLPVAARYTTPAGYLGTAFEAFNIKGDPEKPQLELNGLKLSKVRFEDRQSMLTQLDNLSRLASVDDGALVAHDKFSEEALSLLTGGSMQQAMRIEDEPQDVRNRYGDNMYGRRVLLGRRLIEAGARFVTINQAVQGGLFGAGSTNGTWDNHHLLFESMMSFEHAPANIPGSYKWHSTPGPGNLPQLDMSLSTLLDDLEERGLLETTLVVVMGEFGRTPRINKNAGRDHYPGAGSFLLAGAGIQGGVVVGETDRNGTGPITRPCRPEDAAATIYRALGIDPHLTYFPRLTRPTPIADGEVLSEVIA